jgi:hypothetical protein
VARTRYECNGCRGPCDHARVPSEFLPPDPYADAPQDAGRPVFVPPNAPAGGREARRGSNPAVGALGAGAAALGLLAITSGALFFVTLPAAIAGWVLGRRAKLAEGGSDQGNVAVIIGIVGTVFGVIAAIVWIVIVAEPE